MAFRATFVFALLVLAAWADETKLEDVVDARKMVFAGRPNCGGVKYEPFVECYGVHPSVDMIEKVADYLCDSYSDKFMLNEVNAARYEWAYVYDRCMAKIWPPYVSMYDTDATQPESGGFIGSGCCDCIDSNFWHGVGCHGDLPGKEDLVRWSSGVHDLHTFYAEGHSVVRDAAWFETQEAFDVALDMCNVWASKPAGGVIRTVYYCMRNVLPSFSCTPTPDPADCDSPVDVETDSDPFVGYGIIEPMVIGTGCCDCIGARYSHEVECHKERPTRNDMARLVRLYRDEEPDDGTPNYWYKTPKAYEYARYLCDFWVAHGRRPWRASAGDDDRDWFACMRDILPEQSAYKFYGSG